MKNKIICLLLAIVMVFGMFALTACGDKEDPDKDDNKKPSGGGNNDDTTGGDEEAWWDDITYQETNLRFKMTKNSNSQELPSGCERFLAGETDDVSKIDEMVDTRNDAALKNANVTLT